MTFEEIFTYENLYISYRNCAKGVRWKKEVQKFISRAPLEIELLHEQLMNGKYKLSNVHAFTLMERGKERHIEAPAFRDRIVQRCLCDYGLVPVLSRSLIYDCGATLAGKGVSFTRNRLIVHLREAVSKMPVSDIYILTYDFSKYFESIQHDKIQEIIEKKFDDERVTELVMKIIKQTSEKGLGLGSQISQILALTYASPIDHMFKDELGYRWYARYMDDGYLIGTKEELLKVIPLLEQKTKECGIILNPKKTCIHRVCKGFSFLKIRYFVNNTGKIVKRMLPSAITRQRRKMKRLAGEIDEIAFSQSFQSWKAGTKRLDAYKTTRKMQDLYDSLYSENYKQEEESAETDIPDLHTDLICF